MPADVLTLAAWYAVKAPRPDTGRNTDGDSEDDADLESTSLYSVRGGKASSIAHMLFDHLKRLDFFHPHLERMVEDESVGVRTQVADALLPVLNVDRSLAVALLLRLCDTPRDGFLATHRVYQFLYHACYAHLAEMTPLLDRMLMSTNEKTIQAGVQIVCIVALGDPAVGDRAASCLRGRETARKAAVVAAANITRAGDRNRCERVLMELFDDDAEQVREASIQCFQVFKKDELGEFPSLVAAFIKSRAFEGNAFWFFRSPEPTTALLPDTVCEACERTVELQKAAPLAERHRSGRSAGRNSDLILRLYERTASQDVKRRCLDIIDLTLQYDIYGLESALSDRES